MLAFRPKCSSQKAVEKKGSAKGAPFPSLEESPSRDRDLMGSPARRDPQSDAPYPARTATAVYSFSVFSAAGPAVCCSCRLSPVFCLLLTAAWRRLLLTLQPRAAF